ncbi:MAG: hypothetical protein ACFFDH_03345 [Promethearchaeota archaeon]
MKIKNLDYICVYGMCGDFKLEEMKLHTDGTLICPKCGGCAWYLRPDLEEEKEESKEKNKLSSIKYGLLIFSVFWAMVGTFLLLTTEGIKDNSFINYTAIRIVAIFFIVQFFFIIIYTIYKFHYGDEND